MTVSAVEEVTQILDRGFPVGPHTIFRGASGSKDFFREPLSRWYHWLLTRCCLTMSGVPRTTNAGPLPNNSGLEWCMRITRRGMVVIARHRLA